MNSGYFTSRHEILEWINGLLKLELTKVEQLGSGHVYCHILDAAYPGKVPMNKVKWNAFLEVDFLHNFKVLQTCFEKLGIHKSIDTQKLTKAKYQDNLEFIQWMKWHIAPLIKENPPYNPEARRNHNEVYLLFTDRRPEGKKQHKSNAKLENKQNIHGSGTINNPTATLKTYKSQEQIKIMPFNEHELRRAFEKGESLKVLLEPNQNKSNCDFKKTKKRKLEVTLKPSFPLQQRQNNVKLTEEEECF